MSRPRKLPYESIVAEYLQLTSCHALAAKYGCTAPGILKVLRNQGVPIRPTGPAQANRLPAISLYREAENLLVYRVDQDLHHVEALMATGLSHAAASRALLEHQKQQPKQAIYLWKEELGLPGVQRMLEHRNGSDSSQRIHARDCVIEEVSKETADVFYDAWHLQGTCNYLQKTMALIYEGAPVAMMSFSDPYVCRGTKVPWLLQRFAASGRVPGAASRLLSAFRRGNPGAIVSYSDNRYSPTGGLYKTLGFTLQSEAKPDYRYWRGSRWYAKSSKQRKDLIKELGGCLPEDTEYTMAARAGYLRCYDCGKRTWILT